MGAGRSRESDEAEALGRNFDQLMGHKENCQLVLLLQCEEQVLHLLPGRLVS